MVLSTVRLNSWVDMSGVGWGSFDTAVNDLGRGQGGVTSCVGEQAAVGKREFCV